MLQRTESRTRSLLPLGHSGIVLQEPEGQKQHKKFPPMDERRSVHVMEEYSALKRRKVLTRATTRMNRDDIMLSGKKLATEGQILHDSIHMKYP